MRVSYRELKGVCTGCFLERYEIWSRSAHNWSSGSYFEPKELNDDIKFPDPRLRYGLDELHSLTTIAHNPVAAARFTLEVEPKMTETSADQFFFEFEIHLESVTALKF
jgi:hypothetical protein